MRKPFNPGKWQEEINVRDFIINNYTLYTGDASFLQGPSEKTQKVWVKCKKLLKQEIVVKSQKQVAALKYFATGLNDEDKKLLLDGGAKGMSTFMSYYILKAIASFDKPRAIEIMKEWRAI